jgi:hypothetical protein
LLSFESAKLVHKHVQKVKQEKCRSGMSR